MNTRPPPPKGKYAPQHDLDRRTDSNTRPVVIAVGALSALWTLLSRMIGFFRSINTDKQEGVPKLATFAIVLGAVYMAMFLIDTLGVIAAVSVTTVALVRIYAYATFVAIGLTVGGGILEVVVHFTSKSDILKEDAYDRSSWQNIVSLLIYIFLTVSFSMLAWGYYRQVLDPTSVVNFARAPPSQFNAYPMHAQPYNASVPNLGYNAPYGAAPYGPPQSYAPPPGAPPASRDMSKPAYGGEQVGYGGEDDKENPFADFDERTERDVTSRPAPGGQSTVQPCVDCESLARRTQSRTD
ncbi:hypothetical protein B0H14DRAFT_3465752 [Mycena olivaceomarginata]|nr:hypothetical protein B0H14DRAFT_3465752 [Mycena olivaceomarginata]